MASRVRDKLYVLRKIISQFFNAHRFANKKAFILVFGVVGLIFSSTHSYYNGTITTIEKRFKIPTRNIGLIATGNDITSLLLSTFIAYYVAQSE